MHVCVCEFVQYIIPNYLIPMYASAVAVIGFIFLSRRLIIPETIKLVKINSMRANMILRYVVYVVT